MNSQASSPQGAAERDSLDQAFDALSTYDRGASRASLLPIDSAVHDAGKSPQAAKKLEARFLQALADAKSAPAREYILDQLTLLGGDATADALHPGLLTAPNDTAVRNTLEAIPGSRATKALLQMLPRSDGAQKLGVIASLGVRHDANTVRALNSLLHDADPETVCAAVAALGQTGTRAAGKLLLAFVPQSEHIRRAYASAALSCADHLLGDGHKEAAMELYSAVSATDFPPHVRVASARGLKACS